MDGGDPTATILYADLGGGVLLLADRTATDGLDVSLDTET